MKDATALSIDPGTHKCGIAVVRSGAPPQTLYREVVPTPDLGTSFQRVFAEFQADIILIGDATNARAVETTIRPLLPTSFPIEFVPETFTSEQARVRWCRETPPKHLWERLLPGFRTPTSPVDDYAAVILAEQFFAGRSRETTSE